MTYYMLNECEHLPGAIFDAHQGEDVPAGFTAVRILLDAQGNTDLNWTATMQAAERYVAQGLQVLWELDCGLFDRLRMPLSDHTQFLSLALAIDHFRDTVWKQFQPHTAGVILYRGGVDFQLRPVDTLSLPFAEWLRERCSTSEIAQELGISSFDRVEPDQLKKTKEGNELLSLFYRDVAVEYLALLAARLPDGLQPYALFDGTSMSDPLLLVQLLSTERLGRITCMVRTETLPSTLFHGAHSLGREKMNAMPVAPVSIGICLPLSTRSWPSLMKPLRAIMYQLIEDQVPFRVVLEEQLTSRWDGLDQLIVVSECVSGQGVRKLRGFCAAGGTVLSIGKPLGLPLEKPYS